MHNFNIKALIVRGGKIIHRFHPYLLFCIIFYSDINKKQTTVSSVDNKLHLLPLATNLN